VAEGISLDSTSRPSPSWREAGEIGVQPAVEQTPNRSSWDVLASLRRVGAPYRRSPTELYPQRLDDDASFAALCGASPIQASSGKTRRHRLNRGGDRQANAALYRIAFTRLRCDPRTRDYLDRRAAQGKTRREAIRCIKRYIAREVYSLIRNGPTPATARMSQPFAP
jgi:hypothetical protein